MTVYDVARTKMGNTTLSTVSVWTVRIISVDVGGERCVASWNGNTPKTFYTSSIKRWRRDEPALVELEDGRSRLATRAELKALQNKS